jgi:hypothetical protein
MQGASLLPVVLSLDQYNTVTAGASITRFRRMQSDLNRSLFLRKKKWMYVEALNNNNIIIIITIKGEGGVQRLHSPKLHPFVAIETQQRRIIMDTDERHNSVHTYITHDDQNSYGEQHAACKHI